MNPLHMISAGLRYPDAGVLEARTSIASAAGALPPSPAADALRRFTGWWAARPGEDLQREYVATFDFSRRTCLDLTYCSYGDRRQRGLALVALRRRYADRGMDLDGEELPDHLPVMCEYAAEVPGDGIALLCEFRPAIELIGLSLHDAGSSYAHLITALTALLPALTQAERDEVRRLALEGPPTESVGLEPFAPPEVMPEPRRPACAPGRSIA
ncbi:MAG: nitrate reductase molybdenum cofactor assembly chaperone [Thermoleophilia bacterium]